MELVWIIEAKYIEDYIIELTFNDGFNGLVDLKNKLKGQIFNPLKNKDYFKKFTLNNWTIEWDCNVDFAPEYLYNLATEQNPIKTKAEIAS